MNKQTIIHGESRHELSKMKDNSVDAIITDPPYGLGKEPIASEVLKDWLEKGYHEIKSKGGFMGKEWDSFVPQPILWKECFRVLKPGGFLLSFAGTRTYDWVVMGLRLSGFEIRDMVSWLFGSGFPKSHNIGIAVDKLQGNEREILGEKVRGDVQKAKKNGSGYLADPANRNNVKQFGYGNEILTKGNSDWEGWGTALKPAVEPIVVARKPLSEKTVALNVLKWGTGGINIDACRVSLNGEKQPSGSAKRIYVKNKYDSNAGYGNNKVTPDTGRFPANVIFNEEAARILDEQTGELKSGSGAIKKKTSKGYQGNDYGKESRLEGAKMISHNDKGGASRFFYCAKASKSERNLGCEELDKNYIERDNGFSSKISDTKIPRANNHPTVKPIKLMEYLIKLVSPEGATILDPFLGSGTTLLACKRLNRKGIGIEEELDYIKIARARLDAIIVD